MIIAVDFDGTIVEHKYPEIGRELPFAIETLKKLQQERVKPLEQVTLEPYERDHAVVVGSYR